MLPWRPYHPGGGARPAVPSKFSELWIALLLYLGRARTWQLDHDDEEKEANYEGSNDMYCAMTLWKPNAEHIEYALF